RDGEPDLRALAAEPEAPAPDEPAGGGPSATEQIVTGIWAQVLDTPAPQPDDDFFDTGGDSAMAIQLAVRSRAAVGVAFNLTTLFERPTVAGVVAAVDAALRAGHIADVTPISRIDRTGHIPLSFGQERLWILDQTVADRSAYNIPLAARLAGRVDV